MLPVPTFERLALISDDAVFAAQISSLFRRARRYLPVMDGPRMERPDADNEVTRRRNALVMAGTKELLLGPMSRRGADRMRESWPLRSMSGNVDEMVYALRGEVPPLKDELRWGKENLGVGLYTARLQRRRLVIEEGVPAPSTVVDRGTHLLIACEEGDDIAQVVASNLAFPWDASFVTFSELPKELRSDWIEELYALGDGRDTTARFQAIAERARQHVGIDLGRFRNVVFVTGGFPFGIAYPEVPTTHMTRYPDFGRAVISGLWASQSSTRSARTALLIDPHTVAGSELAAIDDALQHNGTLVRRVEGKWAHSTIVQLLLDVLPSDVIVLSSHSGDAPGERVTYEYPDGDGRLRRLVVDQVRSFAKDFGSELIEVREFHHYNSIDGVDWRDRAAKEALPVGSALTTWLEMELKDRQRHVVAQEKIDRVPGSMAISLHDGPWIFASHGLHPETAPIVLNNSCWSWHQLCEKFTFAGARGYVGTLFPVLDAEAQEVAVAAIARHSGMELYRALWLAQRGVYGVQGRRPYVVFGLPTITILPNRVDALDYLYHAYEEAIASWMERSLTSPHTEVRRNAGRFVRFLVVDFRQFKRAYRDIFRSRVEQAHRPP